MDALDLNSIQKTELLASNAAKDKIMVKPKRTSIRGSRKKSENSSPSRLTSVGEESPSGPNVNKENEKLGSAAFNFPEKVVSSEDRSTSPPSCSTQSPHILSDSTKDVKVSGSRRLNLPNFALSLKGENGESSPTSPSLVTPTAKSPSPLSPNMRLQSQVFSTSTTQLASSPTASLPSDNPATSTSPGFRATKKGALLPSTDKYEEKANNINTTDIAEKQRSQVSQNNNEHEDVKLEVDVKTRMNQFLTPAFAGSKFGSSSNAQIRTQQKFTDSGSCGAVAAKENKTERHWINNKSTTPTSESRPVELQEQVITNSVDKTSSLVTIDAPASNNRRPENIKLFSPTNIVSSASEPSWRRSPTSAAPPAGEQSWRGMMRKKKDKHEANSEDNTIDPNEDIITGSKVNISSSGFDKKHENTRNISTKFTKHSENLSKKDETSEPATSARVDTSNLENYEINVSEPNSVTASRSLFNSNSNFSNQRDKNLANPGQSQTGDKAKVFSGSLSTSNKNYSKTAADQDNDPAEGSSGSKVDTKSGFASFGGSKSQQRAGVTSSSYKFQTRGTGSRFPASPTTPTAPSVPSTTTASSHKKTDTSNFDNSKTPIPPSTTTAQPPFSSNSRLSYTGYLSKSSTNLASASKPPETVSQPSFKIPLVSTKSNPGLDYDTADIKPASSTSNIKSNPFLQNSSSHAFNKPYSTSSPGPETSSHTSTATTTPSFKSNSSTFTNKFSTQTPNSTSSSLLKTSTTSTEKLLVVEKTQDKKPDNSTKIPSWRDNLMKKELKIEIIETSPATLSSRTSSEHHKKISEKDNACEKSKTTEPTSNADTILQMEKASKVLDMVKNFQNLKATS